MKPYYYVNRVKGGKPTLKHATLYEAQKESERLAALYPGEAFEILMCIGITQTPKANTFWMDGLAP